MAKDKKNPTDKREEISGQAQPELETDKFTEEEQKEIVKMVILDAKNDIASSKQWIEDRVKDIQRYDSAKPSKLHPDMVKEDWMSDKNLGLCAATCDAYQATFMATCWNQDTIYFKATEVNDLDNKADLEKFTKWMVGPNEADLYPEVDDFIQNKVTQGVSYFKIFWKVWYEWIDRRIPKYGIDDKFIGYDIKTERKRFSKGVMRNIPDVSDILMPTFGSTLQDKDHLIEIIHTTGKDMLEEADRNIMVNVTQSVVDKIKTSAYDHYLNSINETKASQLGLKTASDLTLKDLNNYPIDIYEWYGEYTKNGRTEQYRFRVEPEYEIFLAGKPLRKITRSGKRPYVGGPLFRKPGFVRGKSFPQVTAHVCDAINGIWNQKSDFQYVENCPNGFYDPDEINKKQLIDLKPGKLHPISDPKSVVMPNHSRSMAWAHTDIQLLFEILERQTGAASYFLTAQSNQSTATRDNIVNEKSETRFGLLVNRIQDEICEGITMLVNMYQDWCPHDLGERVLGEDGKKLFKNLSIESIRGKYNAYMTPNIIAGSKSYEKEIALWGLEFLSQSVWFDPTINPKGSWKLHKNAIDKVGLPDAEGLMPPEPKAAWSDSKDVGNKITQIKQGEEPVIEEGDDIMGLFMGFTDYRDENYYELDPEYKPIFDRFFFKLSIAFQEYIAKRRQEIMVNRMAMQAIQAGGTVPPQPVTPQIQQPQMPQAPGGGM